MKLAMSITLYPSSDCFFQISKAELIKLIFADDHNDNNDRNNTKFLNCLSLFAVDNLYQHQLLTRMDFFAGLVNQPGNELVNSVDYLVDVKDVIYHGTIEIKVRDLSPEHQRSLLDSFLKSMRDSRRYSVRSNNPSKYEISNFNSNGIIRTEYIIYTTHLCPDINYDIHEFRPSYGDLKMVVTTIISDIAGYLYKVQSNKFITLCKSVKKVGLLKLHNRDYLVGLTSEVEESCYDDIPRSRFYTMGWIFLYQLPKQISLSKIRHNESFSRFWKRNFNNLWQRVLIRDIPAIHDIQIFKSSDIIALTVHNDLLFITADIYHRFWFDLQQFRQFPIRIMSEVSGLIIHHLLTMRSIRTFYVANTGFCLFAIRDKKLIYGYSPRESRIAQLNYHIYEISSLNADVDPQLDEFEQVVYPRQLCNIFLVLDEGGRSHLLRIDRLELKSLDLPWVSSLSFDRDRMIMKSIFESDQSDR